jgi:hypothetical protein
MIEIKPKPLTCTSQHYKSLTEVLFRAPHPNDSVTKKDQSLKEKRVRIPKKVFSKHTKHPRKMKATRKSTIKPSNNAAGRYFHSCFPPSIDVKSQDHGCHHIPWHIWTLR